MKLGRLCSWLITAALMGGSSACGSEAEDGSQPEPTAAARAATATPDPDFPRRVARDYAMFTKAGDRAMYRLVRRVTRLIEKGASRHTAMQALRTTYAEVADAHDEALDTAVTNAVADEVDRWLVAAGHDPIDAIDEFAL